jgi:hypothetical protein
MMNRIYSEADHICIWLGENADDSEEAMKFIRNQVPRVANFEDTFNKSSNIKRWEAFLKIMQREWFSRRWVVQELALASDATIYCDWETLAWEDFALAGELCIEVQESRRRLYCRTSGTLTKLGITTWRLRCPNVFGGELSILITRHG